MYEQREKALYGQKKSGERRREATLRTAVRRKDGTRSQTTSKMGEMKVEGRKQNDARETPKRE